MTQRNTMWLISLLVSSSVRGWLLSQPANPYKVGCLLFAPPDPIFPFSPFSGTSRADRSRLYLGPTWVCFLVGFAQWEAPAGDGGRKESEVGCLGWAPCFPLAPLGLGMWSPPHTHTLHTAALSETLPYPLLLSFTFVTRNFIKMFIDPVGGYHIFPTRTWMA